MAMEALKSAGIKAYQGSSLKPAVKVVEATVQPETPVAVAAKNINVAEIAGPKIVKAAEAKPDTRVNEAPADGGDKSHRVQERPMVWESAKAPEPVMPEGRETAEGAVSNESLKRAVEEINRKTADSEAVFGIHESTNRVTIKIVDKKTKEVLKEYPPEKTLDMIAKVWELAGLLVDEKR